VKVLYRNGYYMYSLYHRSYKALEMFVLLYRHLQRCQERMTFYRTSLENQSSFPVC